MQTRYDLYSTSSALVFYTASPKNLDWLIEEAINSSKDDRQIVILECKRKPVITVTYGVNINRLPK